MSCCAEHQLASSGWAYLLSAWGSSPLVTSIVLGPVVLALALFYPALVYLTPKEKPLPASAFLYTTAEAPDKKETLPKLLECNPDDNDVQLSIVVPAFNEEVRLPKMLDEACAHLRQLQESTKVITGEQGSKIHSNGHATATDSHHKLTAAHAALQEPLRTFEIIIVDDGSRDATPTIALDYAKKNKLGNRLRLVRLGRNCGKGKAVRHGVLHARGTLIAFCDADGATRFSDLSALAKEMKKIITPNAGHGIVCGSRAHLVGSEAVVKRSFARNFLMHSFHFILSLLMRPPNPAAWLQSLLPAPTPKNKGSRQRLPTQPPIRDTQCGFKLFTRASAQAVFPLAHIDRWIFDVELLLLAEMASYKTLRQTAASAAAPATTDKDGSDSSAGKLSGLPLPISEVAVDWREVEGSKIDILKDSIGMGLDLLVIRLNYALGRWQTPGVLETSGEKTANACCQ